MRSIHFLLCALLLLFPFIAKTQCACCSGAGLGSAIFFGGQGNSVSTKKTLTLETFMDVRRIQSTVLKTDSSETEIPLKGFRVHSVGLRYGISHKLSVGLLLPYSILHSSVGNDRGFGDLMTVFNWNAVNRNGYQVVIQGGMEWPTGAQILSQKQQTIVMTGSGSYDPLGGLQISKNVGRWSVQTSMFYKKTTKGFEEKNFGDVHTHQLLVAYKVCEQMSSCDTADCCSEKGKWNITVFTGYYGEYLGSIVENGVKDDNSGYYAAFSNVGLHLNYANWTVPFSVSLPVYQQMNGEQNHPGVRVRIGVMKTFNVGKK